MKLNRGHDQKSGGLGEPLFFLLQNVGLVEGPTVIAISGIPCCVYFSLKK